MVKGEQRQQGTGEVTRYVGFTPARPLAVNPTKEQLNKLLGVDDKETDKEFVYLGEDDEGNKRVRLSFWMFSEDKQKYFPYSINLTNKEVVSKDKGKTQYINSTCSTSWVDDEANLPDWFTHFLEKDTEEVLGDKKYRKAILGEAELGTFVRSWLGRMNFNSTNTEVLFDTKKLFNEDYSELRELIDSDYDTPFVILTGVRTDPDDKEKQYQQVYGKGFLPANFYKFILKGNKFSSGYAQKVWDKFLKEVEGEYGFKAYYELVPLCEYDRSKDPAQSDDTQVAKEPDKKVTAINPKF
jgi:hypothetical protein